MMVAPARLSMGTTGASADEGADFSGGHVDLNHCALERTVPTPQVSASSLERLEPRFENSRGSVLRSQIDRSAFKNPRDLNAEIPAALEKVILTCLDKEPDKRYPIASVMVHDLETILYV